MTRLTIMLMVAIILVVWSVFFAGYCGVMAFADAPPRQKAKMFGMALAFAVMAVIVGDLGLYIYAAREALLVP